MIDVQTHLIDPSRWGGAGSQALSGFLRLVDPERWGAPVDPANIDGAAWASLVFGSSETAVALLTSTPGTPDRNVLSNPQIAAARDLVDRYAGPATVATYTVAHGRDGAPEWGLAICDLPSVDAPARAYARIEDPEFQTNCRKFSINGSG